MGKSKHQNPYREGTKYHRIFADFSKRARGVASVTRQTLIDNEIAAGSSKAAATSAVGVVLSPVKESEGDCRGNMSAMGHLYYGERKPSKENKRTLRYSLRWRETPLEPHRRSTKSDEAPETPETPEIENKTEEPTEQVESAESVEESAEAEAPAEEATEEA